MRKSYVERVVERKGDQAAPRSEALVNEATREVGD